MLLKLLVVFSLFAHFDCYIIQRNVDLLRGIRNSRIRSRETGEEIPPHRLRFKATESCFRCKDRNRNITIAVLAPVNDSLPYSLNKILPSIIYAVRQVNKNPDYPALMNRTIEVVFRDTACSSTQGPLAAFDFFIDGTVDIFFGPLCPYVLAPVARYAAVWDIPVITTAGQNDNFDFKQPHYPLLTRMNGRYSEIGNILVKILAKFDWQVLGLIYHNFEDRNKGNSACYFTLGAAFAILGNKPFHRNFDETKFDETDYKQLLREISLSSR
ncbi:Atrial natriuretic peptide receptor 3-like protein, partial [Leptotrombidium deliense]